MSSKKGRGGGYVLARAPEDITLGTVIRLIEGPLAPVPCASETAFHQCDECVDADTCGTSIVMREVRDAMAAILDRTTLAIVCRKIEDARTAKVHDGAFMYYI